MTKALASLVLILAMLLAGAGYGLKSQYDSIHDLRAANEVLTEAAERATARAKQDRQVLVARQAQVASTARKLALTERALQEALQANKSWSDTDVPEDVQRALGGPSSGLPERL